MVGEIVLDDDHTGPMRGLLQSLNMLVQTRGRERSSKEYSDLLENHGFHDIQVYRSHYRVLDVLFAKKK